MHFCLPAGETAISPGWPFRAGMERGSKSGFAQGYMCDCAMSAWAVSSHPFPSSMTRRWGSTPSWVGMDHHALGSTDTHNLSGCDPRSQRGADLPSTISGDLGTAAWSSPSFSLYLPSRDQHSLPFRSLFLSARWSAS